MFFSLVMICLAFVAVAFMWFVTGWLGAIAFAVTLIAVYWLFTRETGRARPLDRTRLNAAQRPLSDG